MSFYKFLQNLTRPFFHILFRVEKIGVENIPKDQGVIICSNHLSYLDPVVISYGVKQKIAFLGKEELFKKPFSKWFFTKLLVIPISRGKGDMGAINKCIDIINSGGTIGIFPEGKRSTTGELLAFKSGASFIAKETKADIIPVAIKIHGGKAKPFCKITINYGKLIKNEELGLSEQSLGALKQAKRVLEGAVGNLLEEIN